MNTCLVEDCQNPPIARGLCNKHYKSWKIYGEPKAGPLRHGLGSVKRHGYRVQGVNGVQRYEHILVAEKALGHALPVSAVVHHIDENSLNNAPDNLVILPDQAFHMLIHQRTRALAACGHADWMKCEFCKEYEHPSNLTLRETTRGTRKYHPACATAYWGQRKLKRSQQCSL